MEGVFGKLKSSGFQLGCFKENKPFYAHDTSQYRLPVVNKTSYLLLKKRGPGKNRRMCPYKHFNVIVTLEGDFKPYQ